MSISKWSEHVVEEIRQSGMWVVAFVGVCIMVGLGKLKPETVEYVLFALLGKTMARKPEEK